MGYRVEHYRGLDRIWMDGRTYHVQIDGASSECVPLWCGEPQGSVLGPILFTMYTAPMNRILQGHGVSYHTYADDIYIYVLLNLNIESDKKTI